MHMQMAEVTSRGALLPDNMVLELLRRRLASGAAAGERGVLLDGFPRTRAQAVHACCALAPARRVRLLTPAAVLTRSCWTPRCTFRRR